MKYLSISLLFWVLVACQHAPTSSHSQAVDAAGFQQAMTENPDAILLDIRTSEEVAQGKILGATVIDYYSQGFAEKIKALDTTKPILIYCAVGGRSQSALPILSEAGFTQIYHLSSGIQGWIQEGYTIEK